MRCVHGPALSAALAILLAGCPTADGDDDDTTDATADDDTGGQPDDDLEDTTFAPFEPWAEPLEDYIDALTAEYGGEGFHHSVWDLALYEQRLYLGYGDADINSGRIFPTEARYFEDPDDPGLVTSDFAVDEEMIEQYRHFEGDDGLYIAGLDATEDDLWGNAYNRHPDTAWLKSRTLEHALHVHDIALFGDDLYASGSGCTWDEYDAFQISSMLWHSSDGGETFEVVEKMQNPASGDARWVRLLPLGEELYLFGYRTDTQYINDFIPYRFDGETLEPFEEMDRKLADNTWVVGDGLGLVSAISLPVFGDAEYASYLLSEGGQVRELDAIGDTTVVDAFGLDDGRWLLLVREGTAHGDTLSSSHEILLTADFEQFHALASYDDDTAPTALALWDGALHLGLQDGTIWRAVPQ
jgi:hypothetical protein